MNSGSVKIREYRAGDSESLARLFFQTIRRINIRDYTQAQVEAWAPENRDMEEWRNSFVGKAVFLAETDEKILGFGELESNGHIDRFYIDADSIGKGVGKMIYESIESLARSQKLVRLLVEASVTAQPFFMRMGFHVVHEQTVDVHGVKMNNFVMEKDLCGSS
jgi:putative acetyltransferase